MTLPEFRESLGRDKPPAGLGPGLKALWLDGKHDWVGAHAIAQEIETSEGALIHAYLHRQEGDQSNADYWYGRAGRASATSSLEVEWEALVTGLLATDG